MSLRTQVQPYVLIGNVADLPNPASVPQCYLYHSADTGDCFILQIEPDTGLRHWTEFCGATGLTGIAGPALLKWAGGGNLTSSGYVIADDVASTNVAVGGITPAYPLFRARTGLNFMINLRNHGTLGDTVIVNLLVNGAVALTHTFAANTPNGTLFNVAGPAAIPANAVIDVSVSSPNGTGACLISATLELF